MISISGEKPASRRASLPGRQVLQAGAFLIVLAASSSSRADFVANFDSLPAAGLSGGLSGPLVTDYLATFGITVSDVTAGSAITVYDTRDIFAGQVVVPSSPFNILSQSGLSDILEYTLNFDQPQDHFSMTRTAIHPGSTGDAYPQWSATAFDSSGTQLETFGESEEAIFTDLPAKVFTFNGPDIKRIRISSDNRHFTAFGAVILDDFTVASVPEPSSLLLATLSGAVILGGQAMRRRRSACKEASVHSSPRGPGLKPSLESPEVSPSLSFFQSGSRPANSFSWVARNYELLDPQRDPQPREDDLRIFHIEGEFHLFDQG